MNERESKGLRALVDANILISYLLSSNPVRSAAAAIMKAAEAGSFALVVPAETIGEIMEMVSEKSWLAARIPADALAQLVEDLRRIVEAAPTLVQEPPRMSRDPDDDYLLAQALLAEVDVVVTRDRDLIELDYAVGLRIVDPVAFLGILRSSRN